jgi:3D (Asp-Asp-Asp) domain-containing protein
MLAAALLAGCAGVRPDPEVGEISPPEPREVSEQRRLLGTFRPTFYCLANEADARYAGLPRDAEIRDIYGRTIARVCRAFKHKADLEGSARLADGRVINFAGRAPDGIRYRVVHGAEYGLGAASAEFISRGEPYKLIPYRSVAVDPKQIPLGSVLYIPGADGVSLPGGEEHDGYFLAHDVGGAITSGRIDLFVGTEEDVRNAFTRGGLGNMSPVEVYQVLEPLAEEIRSQYRRRYTLTGKTMYRMTWTDVEKMLAATIKPEESPTLANLAFKKGDRVKITEGAFENFEGVVDELNQQKGTVRVIVTIFGRPTPIEMEYWQVEQV